MTDLDEHIISVLREAAVSGRDVAAAAYLRFGVDGEGITLFAGDTLAFISFLAQAMATNDDMKEMFVTAVAMLLKGDPVLLERFVQLVKQGSPDGQILKAFTYGFN